VSEHLPGDKDALSSSVAARVDAVCDRFEDAWLADQRPRIEEALEEAQEPERAEMLRQLLRVDLYYRERDGDRPVPEEYYCRFPQQTDLIGKVFAEREPCGTLENPIRSVAGRPAPGVPSRQVRPTGLAPAIAVDPCEPVAAGQFPAVPGHEVSGVLGIGGTAIVYKARQVQLNRLVALKMLTTRGGADPERVARFRTEAQAVARLHHVNIVQVYEIGEYNGLPYISLEFCEGNTLAAHLGGSPLPPREAAQLVETLARAMHSAHERGIIHRDLKPANVLFAAAGRPKISDFGLARMLDTPSGWTASGAILGTPSYMAPEQAAGQTIETGPAVDIYALGAVLYECLTGCPPFRAATPLDTMLQVRSQEPLPLRLFQRKLPRDLEVVCRKCLNKEPAKRYPSAAALADDLQRFRAGEPIRARPMTVVEELDLMFKDKYLVAGFNVLFAFCVGVFGLCFLVFNLVACWVRIKAFFSPTDLNPGVSESWPSAPGIFGSGVILAGFVRPDRRNLVVGGILVAGATLLTLMAGSSATLVAESLGVGAGIAVCLGTAGRVVCRYSGRTVLEILPGLVLGGLGGGPWLVIYVDGIRQVWNDHLLDALLFLGGGFIGAILGGLALGWFHTWRDRWRVRHREDASLMSKPTSLPTHEVEPLTWPLMTIPDQTTQIIAGRILSPLSLAPRSVAALPDKAPAVPGYELLGLLGEGGMGVVYLARHVQLERLVALKVIRAYELSAQMAKERFQIEARSAARLHHPNIVQVYEVGEFDGRPYAALEYVAGGTLAYQLAGRSPLPAQKAAELLETLARAVDVAHRNGILHRDLKPANVLLTPDGQPKIADFGLAKLVDEQAGLTPTDAVFGTPSYMAPEQASGQLHKVGPAADVYALGATLYELLTGRPPFQAATAGQTLKQVRFKEPVPPRRLEPSVPPILEAICLKCLAKEPRRRYASASELASDLRRFRQGQPTRARPPVLWQRSLMFLWLMPLWAEALLVLQVALIIVFGQGKEAPGTVDILLLVTFFGTLFVVIRKRFRGFKEDRLSKADSALDDFPFVPITRCSDGSISVQLSRLRFPSICSDCGDPTTNTLTWDFAYVGKFAIPLCRACQTSFRRRRRSGLLIGVGLVEILVLVFCLVCLLTTGDLPLEQVLKFHFGLGIVFLLPCVLLGYTLAVRTVPVQVSRYSPVDGTVEVRFRSAEYAEKFIASIGAWEMKIQ
jgi:serine/threonine protein kinase